jgi:hypothetical protein
MLPEAVNALRGALRRGVYDALSTECGSSVDHIPITCEDVKDGEDVHPPPPLGAEKRVQGSTSTEAHEQRGGTGEGGDRGGKGGGRGWKKQKASHGKQQNSKPNKVAITLGALVCLHTSTGCVISADAIISERDHKKMDEAKFVGATDEITSTIMSRLCRTISSGACIDEQTVRTKKATC